MSRAVAVLVTLALLAVDARAWLLSFRSDMEGLWVFMHLCLLGFGATAAWMWVSTVTPLDAGRRTGGKR